MIKVCAICGEEFEGTPSRVYCNVCNRKYPRYPDKYRALAEAKRNKGFKCIKCGSTEGRIPGNRFCKACVDAKRKEIHARMREQECKKRSSLAFKVAQIVKPNEFKRYDEYAKLQMKETLAITNLILGEVGK